MAPRDAVSVERPRACTVASAMAPKGQPRTWLYGGASSGRRRAGRTKPPLTAAALLFSVHDGAAPRDAVVVDRDTNLYGRSCHDRYDRLNDRAYGDLPGLITRKGREKPAVFFLTDGKALSRTVLVIGSLRICASPDGKLLALWNADYLTNLGEEQWAIIKLASPYGLLSERSIVQEVFERELYVANQRLQGLLLDPRVIHHTRAAGDVHSCIAGRGAEAQKNRIAYAERTVQTGTSSSRTILCLGPTWEDGTFISTSSKEAEQLSTMVRMANALLSEAILRPPAETTLFSKLRG